MSHPAFAHPDHAPAVTTPCFQFAVVAPYDFDPPGLARFARNKLRSLLASKRRTHRLGAWGVWGEPVTRVLVDLMQTEYGTNVGGQGASSSYGRWVAHLRAMLRVVTLVDAVVVVYGGGKVPADLGRVVEACRWMRVPVRVVVCGGE